ncbi:hypothetical protein H8356DRAFT_1356249 [Neocallimastix lanati (nom. inval.)]|nr:hypothetical protein H8356DRAFT_1356249 [Neocallimastix sp. JGI-2020a]
MQLGEMPRSPRIFKRKLGTRENTNAEHSVRLFNRDNFRLCESKPTRCDYLNKDKG